MKNDQRIRNKMIRNNPKKGERGIIEVYRSEKREDGGVIWFTGISGAGKTTLSQIIGAELKQKGHRTEILDGDVIRTNLSKGLGFSHEDRVANIRRIGFVAKLLARSEVWVLVAAISPYRDIRQEVRGQIIEEGGIFIEVYVRCSIETAELRDRKDLYKRARTGEIQNFTGVSDRYEEPLTPEVIINTEKESPPESASRLLTFLEGFGL